MLSIREYLFEDILYLLLFKVCSLPMPTYGGSCRRRSVPHSLWYYNINKMECLQFSFVGCRTGNMFSSKLRCMKRCRGVRK